MSIAPPRSPERSAASSEWYAAYRITNYIENDEVPRDTDSIAIVHFGKMFAYANGDPAKDYRGAKNQLEEWFPGEATAIAATLDAFFSRYIKACQAQKKIQPFFYNSALEREEVLEAMQKILQKMEELHECFVINDLRRRH